MGFANWREYAEAHDAGKYSFAFMRKIPSQATLTNGWADLSSAAGIPTPNYFASNPLEAARLTPGRGLYHGTAKSPSTMYLTEVMLLNNANVYPNTRWILLDYLLYYPFVDLDDVDPQVMDNATVLNRYEDGHGVMAMLVAAAPTSAIAAQFTFDYINQDGAAKTSPIQTTQGQANNITNIVTAGSVTNAGPFLTLASGDTGIQMVTGFDMVTGCGGLGTLVLVKPLVDVVIREQSMADEVSIPIHKYCYEPIDDEAYLNFIVSTPASIAANAILGRLNFIWT